MLRTYKNRTLFMVLVLAGLSLGSTGCLHGELLDRPQHAAIGIPAPGSVPTELNKVALPEYVIEAPDVLFMQAVVRERETDPDTGKTFFRDDSKLTELPIQPVAGEYTVRPDGTVYLGVYGSVYVTGMTISQAAAAIRARLAKASFSESGGLDPELILVILDVSQYNSKKYFVITDGGGYGEQVSAFPITGNECVLDALANVQGLSPVSSKRNIWVARATPHPGQIEQILPVDYVGITQHGVSVTNYQIFPNDRIYVKAQRIVTFDTQLARVLAPINKLFGVTLLGTSTYNQLSGRGIGFNNTNR